MGSKTITIREEVYHLLVGIKRKDESFSELLERLASKNNSLQLLEKMRGTLDFGNTEEIIADIRKRRKEWR